ncbi:glycoside hydrolase family 10 protein [Dysgonomonas sp. ZJ709]|uniref:glycoside hydrolase family 10 protein n=1 Tax=Dysgonomonas sp. ZJ709 TaxID=2709797 RepID=UPI0013EB9DBE|nr:family 10 glycosylhydrolase [Dysgonomonas sp. ZJ709]
MKRNNILYLSIITIFLTILSSCGTQKQQVKFADLKNPKREFRGAWLSTAWQSRYRTMSPEQMKAYFVRSLDQLQADGINAIIFQVRPQSDTFYKSNLEPWSAHLTGTQGKAPQGNFDPLAFLIEECHKRNMELHAWLNPYRVTTSTNDQLVSNHLYYREPERFVTFGGKIYFDPGIPKNQEYICQVVKDIVMRYDVDAIHMDDYFYPYPIMGEGFPDDKSFNTYGKQQGYTGNQLGDWRRNNVNTLIKDVKYTIASTKPWVRFGISPFGIYRNVKSTPDGSGSNTNGLQNYDDLYADVKLWVEKGWIDYNMPQIYWEIGHTAADYKTLINWWAANNFGQPLYIGQDVKRTMDAKTATGDTQLAEKMLLSRSFPTVHGNCFWPAYELLDNYKGIEDQLRKNYHRYPALIPAYTHMHDKQPKTIGKIKEEYTQTAHILHWTSNHEKYDPETAQYYVVYRFAKGEPENIENAQNIVAITRETSCVLPYEGGKKQYKYVVTAVDAFHNESKGKSKKIKL